MESGKEVWKKTEISKKASVEWWDTLASEFKNHKIPTPEDDITMRILEREGMVHEGDHILDVGCGAGRFSVALANLGAEVYGVDLSPKMIEFAKELANGMESVHFEVADWHNMDVPAKNWENRFDLVLANMTPAVTSEESLMNMIAASKNWCYMSKPTRKKSTVLDPLRELIGLPYEKNSFDKSVSHSFGLLWDKGYLPQVEYMPQVWQHRRALHDAYEQYIKRLGLSAELTELQKAKVRDYLEQITVDGFIEETTHLTVVAIYWQV